MIMRGIIHIPRVANGELVKPQHIQNTAGEMEISVVDSTVYMKPMQYVRIYTNTAHTSCQSLFN